MQSQRFGRTMEVWSQSSAATATHPFGGRQVGWDAVRGQAVSELRSLFIVGDACCMCLFEAEDEAAVAALNQMAPLPFTRIVAAPDLTP